MKDNSVKELVERVKTAGEWRGDLATFFGSGAKVAYGITPSKAEARVLSLHDDAARLAKIVEVLHDGLSAAKRECEIISEDAFTEGGNVYVAIDCALIKAERIAKEEG